MSGVRIAFQSDNVTDHRVGSVDVPFENGRKPASGASDGYPLR
ncbi:hypothetical protein RRSWK_00005 [Rhodopirellula sp. SWK7]|nr:hypothetical protein RRSWK_00005 [Rhodopirellula sp. SWK7]